MDVDTLNELETLSGMLALAKGKPAATPRAVPPNYSLHPELVALLTPGHLAVSCQGVDPSRIPELTANARSRGMRRKVLVFGWHPDGHVWFATPEGVTEDARVLVIQRRANLAADEITVADFAKICIQAARAAIAQTTETTERTEIHTTTETNPTTDDTEASAAPGKAKAVMRRAKVVLPECAGVTVTADARTEALDAPDFAYIRWCMTELQLVIEEAPPELSRWEARSLHVCLLAEVPAPGHPDRARYDETWTRLTARDRAQPASVSHQIPSWKLAVPGSWILAPNELVTLRRCARSTPPRHVHTEAQAALWARWMALVTAEHVALYVR
jgi:hypothetical protein